MQLTRAAYVAAWKRRDIAEAEKIEVAAMERAPAIVRAAYRKDLHTYERKAIEAWLKNNNTSPKTNLKLRCKDLFPNQAVRKLVREFLDECARAGVNPDSLV